MSGGAHGPPMDAWLCHIPKVSTALVKAALMAVWHGVGGVARHGMAWVRGG